MIGTLADGVVQTAGGRMADGVPVNIGGGLNDYATIALAVASGDEECTVNSYPMAIDTGAEGDPLIPMFLRGWSRVTSIHADTVSLGSWPTGGWSIGKTGSADVSVTGGLIRHDSGTSGADYCRTQYDHTGISAGEEVVIVERMVVSTVGAANNTNTVEWITNETGTAFRPRWNPRDSGGLQFRNFGGGAVGVAAAAQTTIQTYVWHIQWDDTANQQTRLWLAEDTSVMAYAIQSDMVGGYKKIFYPAYCEASGGNRAVIDVEFCAIYKR